MSTAVAASQIISEALKALNAVREHAKTSKDSDLKEHISTLYDNLLSVKEAVLRLTEENTDLKRQIEEKQSIRRDSLSGLIYKGDDPAPLCPKCYQTQNKSIHLDLPFRNQITGRVSRFCRACGQTYYVREQP
jgi:RNase P subunit RPR2